MGVKWWLKVGINEEARHNKKPADVEKAWRGFVQKRFNWASSNTKTVWVKL